MHVTVGDTDSGSFISFCTTGFRTSACVKAPCCSPAQVSRSSAKQREGTTVLRARQSITYGHLVPTLATLVSCSQVLSKALCRAGPEASARREAANSAYQSRNVLRGARGGQTGRTSRGWSWHRRRRWKSKRRNLKRALVRDAARLPTFER